MSGSGHYNLVCLCVSCVTSIMKTDARRVTRFPNRTSDLFDAALVDGTKLMKISGALGWLTRLLTTPGTVCDTRSGHCCASNLRARQPLRPDWPTGSARIFQ